MVTTTAAAAATLSEPRRAPPGALGCPLAPEAPVVFPGPRTSGEGLQARCPRWGCAQALSVRASVSRALRGQPLWRPTASTRKDLLLPLSFGTKPQNESRRADLKSTFQTFGKEVCLIDHSMCPVPSTVHREPICCECQAKFGGCLPVPRVKAMLPYWVPLSLRPRKQIQKMVRFYIPKTSEACPCPCHRFGGRLPMPRDQAVMPYWVPQVLRPHKKVVKRQQRCKGVQGPDSLSRLEPPLDLRSWYNRWRICCDGRLLLKWQQLQALHQHEPLAPGRGVSPLAPLLPFSLLTLLQAVLRVVVAIRHLFWV
ncbi:uncharacterized protein C16orf95 homolog [Zalophus californianus]|uniref:Uncharacterized protein C16orf95 homolog n=1 Tax=Zalophus californianus TaxID=9704 RepID=A0A6P9F596_ZALCA|nr:uncharacterized protein C16orf95 homolog [Zalophus californianus]